MAIEKFDIFSMIRYTIGLMSGLIFRSAPKPQRLSDPRLRSVSEKLTKTNF